MTPEERARQQIDKLLEKAGWAVQDFKHVNIHAAKGIAIREYQLPGFGAADYLLYVNGKAAGVIEAKKEGDTLTGVEIQSDKYKKGLPESLPAWQRPLPFCYESTGIETRFTNGFEPEARSRQVFAFHKPEALYEFIGVKDGISAEEQPSYGISGKTLRERLCQMPELIEAGL